MLKPDLMEFSLHPSNACHHQAAMVSAWNKKPLEAALVNGNVRHCYRGHSQREVEYPSHFESGRLH